MTISKTVLWSRALALVAIVFGALTLKEGGDVLFGGDAARAAAGNYVPFVLWFNFLAGCAYVAAGVGLWLRRRWAWLMAAAIFIATLVVFATLAAHIFLGGSYEARTLVAMSLRTIVWGVIAWFAHQVLNKPTGKGK